MVFCRFLAAFNGLRQNKKSSDGQFAAKSALDPPDLRDPANTGIYMMGNFKSPKRNQIKKEPPVVKEKHPLGIRPPLRDSATSREDFAARPCVLLPSSPWSIPHASPPACQGGGGGRVDRLTKEARVKSTPFWFVRLEKVRRLHGNHAGTRESCSLVLWAVKILHLMLGALCGILRASFIPHGASSVHQQHPNGFPL